ncbi:Bgt-596 [Blumeria graminis f. sp. tritici]|uniref:Bgt-596 n=2 Tax=Blumeria graminis f. sp. tritici TaxID=62690 RepID=A0A381LDG8_BLUGR|nr:Bgt-596 [Blumeria graminis f. sp. tritici]
MFNTTNIDKTRRVETSREEFDGIGSAYLQSLGYNTHSSFKNCSIGENSDITDRINIYPFENHRYDLSDYQQEPWQEFLRENFENETALPLSASKYTDQLSFSPKATRQDDHFPLSSISLVNSINNSQYNQALPSISPELPVVEKSIWKQYNDGLSSKLVKKHWTPSIESIRSSYIIESTSPSSLVDSRMVGIFPQNQNLRTDEEEVSAVNSDAFLPLLSSVDHFLHSPLSLRVSNVQLDGLENEHLPPEDPENFPLRKQSSAPNSSQTISQTGIQSLIYGQNWQQSSNQTEISNNTVNLLKCSQDISDEFSDLPLNNKIRSTSNIPWTPETQLASNSQITTTKSPQLSRTLPEVQQFYNSSSRNNNTPVGEKESIEFKSESQVINETSYSTANDYSQKQSPILARNSHPTHLSYCSHKSYINGFQSDEEENSLVASPKRQVRKQPSFKNHKTRLPSRNKTRGPLDFVNFTPNDSLQLLTGVAPSGSNKTKARREKEALEKRVRLSQAALRAVRAAGGDIRSLFKEGIIGCDGQLPTFIYSSP